MSVGLIRAGRILLLYSSSFFSHFFSLREISKFSGPFILTQFIGFLHFLALASPLSTRFPSSLQAKTFFFPQTSRLTL